MRNILKMSAAYVLISLVLSTPSFAGDASQAYMRSMEKMNADMKKGMDDPDATKAWAKMMVAHHQGAIEMSQTVLKETKDPMIHEMAEKGIKEQTKEQAKLKEWIGKHGS